MTPRQAIRVLMVVMLIAIGQILFKLGAMRLSGDGLSLLWSLVTNPYLIAGLALFAVTTVLWVIVLKDVHLSQAYPLMALGLLLVPTLGVLLFHEPPSWSLAVGGTLMLGGAWLIVRDRS